MTPRQAKGYTDAAEAGRGDNSVGATAESALVSPDGKEMGTVTITQGPKGRQPPAEVMGLAAGGHAIGIKSVGACVPSFGASGGDFVRSRL